MFKIRCHKMKFENQFSKGDSAFTKIISPSDVETVKKGVLLLLMRFYIILGFDLCSPRNFTFIKFSVNICFKLEEFGFILCVIFIIVIALIYFYQLFSLNLFVIRRLRLSFVVFTKLPYTITEIV